MSTRDKIILALWLVIALGGPAWMWFQIRRQDKKEDEREAEQSELDADRDEYLDSLPTRKAAVFALPRGKEKDFQARSRQAESLGFMDDPPKRAS